MQKVDTFTCRRGDQVYPYIPPLVYSGLTSICNLPLTDRYLEGVRVGAFGGGQRPSRLSAVLLLLLLLPLLGVLV